MSDVKYSTYSSKGMSVLGTGVGYGVNEMTETALSMGLNNGRKTLVTGVTKDIENEFLNDIVQDGLSAGLGFVTGQVMQKQEDALKFAYNAGAVVVSGWFIKSKAKGLLKSFKGRKMTRFSDFLSGNDKKAEECRLLADFVKMDLDSSSNSHNPIAQQRRYESKYKHETLEVQKEGVRTNLSKLQIDGMRDTFEMKMKTSSFFVTDKSLIKQMTGMSVVKDKDIKKLNALSSSMVFEDSEGKWIGGNEAMISLVNSLSFNRV